MPHRPSEIRKQAKLKRYLERRRRRLLKRWGVGLAVATILCFLLALTLYHPP